MKLLSISTASDTLSLSIVINKELIATFTSKGNKRHAELISPELKRLINESRLTFSDLDGVCVNLGPGSFTGLRVGLATAKGIIYGANLCLYGYTNFEELIYNAIIDNKIKGKIAVLIPSRKNEFYFAAYDVTDQNFVQLDVFELMTLQDFKNYIHHFDKIVTEKKMLEKLSYEFQVQEIIGIENNSYYGALIIESNPQKYLCDNYFYLEPLYLKNFDLKLKKKS